MRIIAMFCFSCEKGEMASEDQPAPDTQCECGDARGGMILEVETQVPEDKTLARKK